MKLARLMGRYFPASFSSSILIFHRPPFESRVVFSSSSFTLKEAYEVLGLPKSSSRSRVQRTYKQLVRALPESDEGDTLLERLTEAYHTITKALALQPAEHENSTEEDPSSSSSSSLLLGDDRFLSQPPQPRSSEDNSTTQQRIQALLLQQQSKAKTETTSTSTSTSNSPTSTPAFRDTSVTQRHWPTYQAIRRGYIHTNWAELESREAQDTLGQCTSGRVLVEYPVREWREFAERVVRRFQLARVVSAQVQRALEGLPSALYDPEKKKKATLPKGHRKK